MKRLCKNKHWNIVEEYDLDKILYLLIDRTSYINSYNIFIWKNKKNQWHREYDLPAYINNYGEVGWHINNFLNRKNNKPAIVWSNGYCEYWPNDKFIKEPK